MHELDVEFLLSETELERLREPVDDLLAERRITPDEFGQAEGPFRHWSRRLEVDPEPAVDGRRRVVQRVSFELAIPVWAFLFTRLVKRSIRASAQAVRDDAQPEEEQASEATADASDTATADERRKTPWWAPPDRLDERAATVLGLLCVIALFTGYLGTLLSQTNTFFRQEFGVTTAAIGWTLGIVRVGALLALFVVALADRRGRKKLLVFASLAGCAFTIVGAAAPNLVVLGASQTVARAFSTSMAVLIGIIAVEEMPSRSRAYAVSVMTMTGALGAGLAVCLLWVPYLADAAWRVLYIVPILFLRPILRIGRRLPETKRFELRERATSLVSLGDVTAGIAVDEGSVEAAETADAEAADTEARDTEAGDDTHEPRRQRQRSFDRTHIGRLVLLAASALCFQIFVAPASGFQNEYLRTDRGFGAFAIIAFTILTNTPGGIGIVVGGHMADSRGRRGIGAIGVAAGVGFTVLMFLSDNWTIWIWSLLGALIGAIAIPALAVYGPELFPTGARGKANGIINLFSVTGSVIGLAAAGILADRFDQGLSQAIPVLAIGPLIVVLLVLFFYPETTAKELEELNPEDAPLSREILGSHALDIDSIPEVYPPHPGAHGGRGDRGDRHGSGDAER